jgi:rSAM/selenodomain-associated transferase 2
MTLVMATPIPPSLSIVMPVLDEVERLAATLAALAPLREQGVELIVVDGGSADGSVAAASGLADQVISAPRGRARQMNAGAAVASARTLLFLHADTRLPPDAPSLIAKALQSREWGRFDIRIDGHSALLPIIAALMNWRSRLTGIATGDQAIFVRRSAFAAVAGFPDQPLMEDIEICRRLRHVIGAPACLRQHVLTSGRRWDQHGAWRTIVLMWRLRFQYWRGVSAEHLAAAYR